MFCSNHIQIPKRTILKTGTLKSLWQSITNTAINTQKARREREDARDTHFGTKDRETNKRSFAATYFAVHFLSGFDRHTVLYKYLRFDSFDLI